MAKECGSLMEGVEDWIEETVPLSPGEEPAPALDPQAEGELMEAILGVDSEP